MRNAARAQASYVAAVCVLGLLTLGVVVLPRLDALSVARPLELGVLVGLLLLTERFPIRIDTRNGQDLVSVSTAFCCALLLHWDLSVAVLVQCSASLINDL